MPLPSNTELSKLELDLTTKIAKKKAVSLSLVNAKFCLSLLQYYKDDTKPVVVTPPAANTTPPVVVTPPVVTPPAANTTPPVVTPPTTDPAGVKWETITVGPGKQFASLTLAGCYMNSDQKWNNGYLGYDKSSKMGFRVIISPGPDDSYYMNDSGSHSRKWPSMIGWPPYEGNLYGPVIIEGEAGKPAPLLCTDGYGDGVLYYQKGLFNVGDCDATFRHLRFSGFKRQDGYGNYACARLGDTWFDRPIHTNSVLFEDCEIFNCDNGVMGGAQGMNVTFRRCYVHDNGGSAGRTHNLYIGEVAVLTVEDLLSTNCTIGHLLKSRASKTVIRNTRLIGNGGTESACLDVPDAGVLEIDGLICQKSPNSDANWTIHYSGENQDAGNGTPFHIPSSVNIKNLVMVAPPTLALHPTWGNTTGFANASGDGEASSGKGSYLVKPVASGVTVFGLTTATAGLPCTILSAAPAMDLTSPVKA